MKAVLLTLTLLTFIISSLSGQEEESDWNLWPLLTPLLGENISEQCLSASKQYIRLLQEAFTSTDPLTEDQQNAVQMFDSNGRFPFFQEGMLQDFEQIDLCDSLLSLLPDCKQSVPDYLRILEVPLGNANGPGSESGCKKAKRAKYCHNYYQIIINSSWSFGRHFFRNQNPVMNGLLLEVPLLPTFQNIPAKSSDKNHQSRLDLNPENVLNLLDLFMDRDHHVREVFHQLSSLFGNRTLFPDINHGDGAKGPVNTAIGVMIFLWMQANFFNGVGMWGYNLEFAYQGMCFPSVCSQEEITQNSLELSERYQVPGLPTVVSTPEMIFTLDGINPDMAVGCSDDEVYSGQWRAENYIVVTLLSLIAASIVLGTAVDIYDNNPTDHRIIKAFSVVENLKFVFEAPPPGGSTRFGCLEGMRSLSMTWVILGHHFSMGVDALHVMNMDHVHHVREKHHGSILFDVVIQGEYSVDSFLFIGATLLSYLLLKDLDKSNGWFSSGAAVIRMLLFYLNRYLRITIPYVLAIAVYIGVFPLLLHDHMDAGHLAYQEAKECKRAIMNHILYLNIFPDYHTFCVGQSWYLSCEMLIFLFSPLLVYPLWRGKFSNFNKIMALLWWTCLLVSSVGFAYWYVSNTEQYNQHRDVLPDYNFAPWGWRNQCYIVGIMCGYLLWLTKDQEVKIDPALNLVLWTVASVLGLFLVFRTYYLPSYDWREAKLYYAARKAGWGFCLAWVTFACCRGYGGIINQFLSWNLWLPISKVSFMTYLFHMSLNWYFFLLQSYPLNYTMWQLTVFFVPQVWLSLLAGLLGCLTLELPFGKIQKMLIQRLMTLCGAR